MQTVDQCFPALIILHFNFSPLHICYVYSYVTFAVWEASEATAIMQFSGEIFFVLGYRGSRSDLKWR